MTIYKVTCVLDQFDDEILYDKLFEIGAISIDISDYKNDSILDNTNVILSEISEKWENNRLEILFNCQSQNNFELILEKLKKIDNFNLKIENTSKVNEEDWVKRSKDSFKKIQFTNALEVYPSWEKMDESFRYNIQIDPGQAFGTGSHQTTKLCIEWLLQNEKKFSNVIDYGCGSGLLAIIAKTLYKTKVLGVDIDSKAIDVATKNSIANNLDIKFSHVDKVKYETYDLIIANILLNVLTTLKPIFLKILKKQGVIIFTGILENQVETLIEEYQDSFQKVKVFRKDNWALVEMCF